MRKILVNVILSLVLVCGLLPVSAFAADSSGGGDSGNSGQLSSSFQVTDGKLQVSLDDCVSIGTYNKKYPVYYADATDAEEASSVVFTDFAERMAKSGMIAGVKSNAYVMNTNEAPLSAGYSTNSEKISADSNWAFNDGYDANSFQDNTYAYWIVDDDSNRFYVIVAVSDPENITLEAPTFTASQDGDAIAEGDIALEEGGYSYEMYVQDSSGNWNPETRTVDLYTITVPAHTKVVDFEFSSACLAYGYDDDATTCTEGLDEYEGGFAGKTTATRSVDKDGDGAMDFVTVQSPYDASYNSTTFYAITFVYAPPEGTEDDPYVIDSLEDLQEVAENVAAGTSYLGKYLKIVSDITLPADWIPMGTSKKLPFSGNIDGGGHLITVAEGGKCLIGFASKASVSNLDVYGKRIEGYGLVENYSVGATISIDNVTIKAGTQTLKSGLIGGYASGSDQLSITNCVVEEGVVVGYDCTQSNIGAIAGEFNGTISNCQSAATVYGVDFVGGIIANKGQTAGTCSVSECTFTGTIEATGKYVGGIAGAGYGGTTWGIASAPNTPGINISSCSSSGSIVGADYVGGILGAEPGMVQAWNNGVGHLENNEFTGTVSATDGSYLGGIIGYMNSLNKNNEISGNTYSSACGAVRGIGGCKYVDTDCATHETEIGEVYLCTKDGDSYYVPSGVSGFSQRNSNRTDDPLGADADNLCKVISNSSGEDDDNEQPGSDGGQGGATAGNDVGSGDAASPVAKPSLGAKTGSKSLAGSGASHGWYKVTRNKNATVAYAKPSSKSAKSVTVPESVKINGKTYRVTSVADKAFSKCAELMKVTLGKSVTSVGKKAFYGCKKLKRFTAKSSKLKTIESSAFGKCPKLRTIKLSKTTKLSKKDVKGSLKGSLVKTVKVKKSMVKKFRGFFKKSNSGRKVGVKKA